MKIKSLQLSGYKRFSLTNLANFRIDVDSDIQVIIGTNGSGKSSLLEALSPYPQPKSDFIKGGTKELIIEHNNSEYRLLSFYSSSAKHQFIKDGIEYNEGGTAAVQKDLVERELEFNSQLHELLTGKVTFTTMSPLQRREWLMKISNLDLTFAISKYNQIKGQLRDAQGALKHSQVRLGRESQKLLEQAQIESMIEENKALQKRIHFYMSELKNDIPNLNVIERHYENLKKDIEKLSLEIIKSKFSYKKKAKYIRYDQIIDKENDLISKDKTLRALIYEQENQLKEVIETLAQLKNIGLKNKQELVNNLELLKSKRVKNDYSFEIVGDLTAILKDSKSVRMSLFQFVSEAKGDTITVPSKKQWNSYNESLIECKRNINSKDNELLNVLKRIENIENSHKVFCPKCKYNWQPGISEKSLAELKLKANRLNKDLKGLKDEYSKIKAINDNIEIRNDEINQLRSLVHSYPRIKSFWDYIIENKYIHNNPKEINLIYNQWIKELEALIAESELETEIDNITKTLKRLEVEKIGADLNYLTDKEKELTNKVAVFLIDFEANQVSLKELQKYKKDFLNIADKTSELVKLVEELKLVERQIIEGTIQVEIKNQLENDQLALANNRKKESEYQTLNGIIEDLKKDIIKLKEDITSLTALEKALSPNDGLIADSLVSFINNFIHQLNQLIGEVWEYDMRLLPCANSDNDLDYRFPLVVMGSNQPISDICKGSAGQREIIDFIFTLAVMIYLDLKDFPLFLDELGNTFDKTHKSKLILFIKELLDRARCSQLWMVSHYAADHGGLKDAQICVLDSSNIATPKKYNSHVSIS